MIGQAFCRQMHAGEERAVEALLGRAFGGAEEARLVDTLRRQGVMAGEMVLPGADDLIGYYALSWMKRPQGWLCLAPVAIDPDAQRQGHGRRMVGQLSAWAVATRQTVVVLGQRAFYERAGFSGARAVRLQSRYDVAHLALAGPGEDAPQETLVYPDAFGVSE